MAVATKSQEQKSSKDVLQDKPAEKLGVKQPNAVVSDEQKTQGSNANLVPLSKGSSEHARVLELQRRLNDLGISTNGLDGDYGNGTIVAVKAFQERHGFSATGQADLKTLQKLYELVPTPSMGALSAKYESRGGNETVAYDKNGGTSYGKYQIAAKVGSMANFVSFLSKNGYSKLAEKLSAAKPYDTGTKTGACPTVWKENAKALEKPVEEFIVSTYYTQALAQHGESLQKFIDESPTLRDVYLSISVNHGAGGAKTIVGEVYTKNMRRDEFIKKVYARRKSYVANNKYKTALWTRYDAESKMALDLLKLEEASGGKAGSSLLAKSEPQTEAKATTETPKVETSTQTSAIEKSTPETESASTNTQVSINVSRAVEHNKKYAYSRSRWKEIQQIIGFTGDDVDGYVGPATSQKIAEWQAGNGFTGSGIDGICGPSTWAKMQAAQAGATKTQSDSKPASTPAAEEKVAASSPKEAAAQDTTAKQPAEKKSTEKASALEDVGYSGSDILNYGANGTKVTALQKLLNRFGSGLSPDGGFGKGTAKALMKFQYHYGLTQGGVYFPKGQTARVTVATWAKLREASPAIVNSKDSAVAFASGKPQGQAPNTRTGLGGVLSASGAADFNKMVAKTQEIAESSDKKTVKNRDGGYGIQAISSSFRGMTNESTVAATGGVGGSEGAIELFVENDFDSSKAATPGWSNHCTGRAVDIANIGRHDASPLHTWLGKNAKTYNFSPYSAENWHWDYKA